MDHRSTGCIGPRSDLEEDVADCACVGVLPAEVAPADPDIGPLGLRRRDAVWRLDLHLGERDEIGSDHNAAITLARRLKGLLEAVQPVALAGELDPLVE